MVGIGKKINFWEDKWLGNVTLKNPIDDSLKEQENNLKILELINKGSWHLNTISFYFPNEITNKIFKAPFNLTNKEDMMVWYLSKLGVYSTNSVYLSLKKFTNSIENVDFKWIQKVPTLPKI